MFNCLEFIDSRTKAKSIVQISHITMVVCGTDNIITIHTDGGQSMTNRYDNLEMLHKAYDTIASALSDEYNRDSRGMVNRAKSWLYDMRHALCLTEEQCHIYAGLLESRMLQKGGAA